jgi:hypothetical protein
MQYSWTKFVVQRLRARLGPREAILPDFEELTASSGDGEMIDLPVVHVL